MIFEDLEVQTLPQHVVCVDHGLSYPDTIFGVRFPYPVTSSVHIHGSPIGATDSFRGNISIFLSQVMPNAWIQSVDGMTLGTFPRQISLPPSWIGVINALQFATKIGESERASW